MKDRESVRERLNARKQVAVEPITEEPCAVDLSSNQERPKRIAGRLRPSDFEDSPEDLDRVMSGMSREAPDNFNDDDDIDDNVSVLGEEKEASDTAKAIEALLGNGDFRTKTDLSKEEVRALAVLIEISNKFRARRLSQFAENFMALMISHGRGSRKEVVQSFSGLEYFGKGREAQPSAGMPLRAR